MLYYLKGEIMTNIISEYWAKKVNLGGKGGKEKSLKRVFLKSQSINAPLFDIIDANGELRELKKQANTQWFDIGKYHLLSTQNKDIMMTFIMHEKGKIQKIMEIKLGKMLDLLCGSKKYRGWGWTKSNIEMCYLQKAKYPSQQAKVKVEVKKFFTENKKELRILWER